MEMGQVTIAAGGTLIPLKEPVSIGLQLIPDPAAGVVTKSCILGATTANKALVPSLAQNPLGDWTPPDHFTINPDTNAVSGSTKNIYVYGTNGDVVYYYAE